MEPGKAIDELRATLPDGERLTGMRPLTTGFSNDTYLLEGIDLILRLPPAAGAMLDGHGVVKQAEIYRALGEIPDAPPVPAIVLICTDEKPLGAPFFVMERVAGDSIHDTQLQPWFVEGGDALRADVCRQWVSAFAGLARLSPLAVLGDAVSPEDDARMWQSFGRQADCQALVSHYDRLLSVPAPRSGPSAVVHGDTKLSNLMWHDGTISAMLDWEMALNGEPLADLGYMLYGFESAHHGPTTPQRQPGMVTREEVIALWEQVSGRCAKGLFWHEIAQIGKITAIIAEGTNMWNTGRSTDPKLELFAKNLGYYIDVMAAMLDSAEWQALENAA
ncbi:MAG: phosphotransferase family protein [Novosphingobium sp.]|nr:phosphotransferase family protein [Novosphingobium sp.]